MEEAPFVPFYQRKVVCENSDCGAPIEEFVLTRDGFYVCPRCGTVDSGARDYRCTPLYERNPTDYTVLHCPPKIVLATVYRNGIPMREVRTSHNWQGTKGRYRPIFHWNERIAQLQMADPPLPPHVLGKIVNAAISGKYGPAESFTRASVVSILRDLRLNAYRERWKSILADLNPSCGAVTVAPEVLEEAGRLHRLILDEFFRLKSEMPKSVIRANGKCVARERHNVLPFNYEFRKIMEVFGIYDFHAELPLLRSVHKLKALDDVTEKIFKRLNLPFARTAIIKRPKIRRCRKKTQG